MKNGESEIYEPGKSLSIEFESYKEHIENFFKAGAYGLNGFNNVEKINIDLLEKLVDEIPGPEGNPNAKLQALIVHSWFDSYLVVVS